MKRKGEIQNLHDIFFILGLFLGGGGFKLFLNIYISMINENLIVKFHI